jgi:hypothetical protein
MYDVLKDFAGPVATIIAAVVAVFVTARLGNGQQRIAQQQAETAKRQAETAHARLKLDLYDKRFNIYATTLDLYEADMKKELADIEAAEFPFVQAFRESLFLFDGKDGIYDTLNAIKDAHSAISAHERGNLKVKNEYDESARVLSNMLAERGAQGRKDFETLLMTLEGQLAKYLDFRKIT